MCVDDYCFILIVNSWKTLIFAVMNALTLGFHLVQWVFGKGFCTALYYKAQTHNRRFRYKRTPHGPEARYTNAGQCHTISTNQSIKKMSKKCSDTSPQRPQPQGTMFRSRFQCIEHQEASLVAVIQRRGIPIYCHRHLKRPPWDPRKSSATAQAHWLALMRAPSPDTIKPSVTPNAGRDTKVRPEAQPPTE